MGAGGEVCRKCVPVCFECLPDDLEAQGESTG